MNTPRRKGNGVESPAHPMRADNGYETSNGFHPENEELRRRISELESIAREIHESRRAALNVLEDVAEARHEAEELNRSLTKEIAERERAQAQLRAELEDTKLLQSISAEMIHEENVEALYDKITGAAAKIMQADFASLQMLYPERGRNGELLLLASRGFNPQAVKFWQWVRADSESTCGMTLRSGKRSIVSDVDQCDSMSGTEDLAMFLQMGIRSVQSTPLFSRSGKLLGIISTHWRKPHQPGERDLRVFDILARQAADLIERKRAEEALRASEARFRAVVSQATAGISETDFSGRFLFANQRYCDILGYSASELLEMRMQDLTHPEDLPRNLEQFNALSKGGPDFVIEKRYLRKDGTAIWVNNSVSAIRDAQSRAQSVAAVTLDITEQKLATESMRQLSGKLENQLHAIGAIMSSVEDFIYQFDLEGRFTYVNQALLDLWQKTLEEAVGKNFHELEYPPELAARLQDQIQQVIETGRPLRDETSFTSRLGTRQYEYIFAPLHDADGKIIAVAGVTRDFTDRLKTEEQLRASEERFRQFAENSIDVFWIIDARTRRLEYLNPAYEEMFGESREPIMRDLGRWPELIHPQDRDIGADMLPRLFAGENVLVDYRIIRPNDGAIRWIRDSGFPIRDQHGAVTRVAGVLQDITADKEGSEALRESEERFRLLVEGAPDYAMFLLDPANQIIYWNSGAERVFGWTANEALGKNGELIFTPEDRVRKQEQKEMQTALRKGVAPDRRWHMRKDGSRVWIDGVMRRLLDEKGNLRGFAKIARDATETHRAEEALQNSHLELEHRVRERTAELTALNKKLRGEMKQRAQVEQELLLVSEREKRRIGQDLHDSLCQELAAAALFLQTAAQKMEKKAPSGAKVLTDAARIVNDNVGLARDLARGLHPVELTSSGLAGALRELAFRTSQVRSVICHFESARQVRIRDEAVVLNLYRIAQEAVTNSVKNGKAAVITIRLARDRSGLALTVKDNGRGFSTSKLHHGMGLHIMKYRADVIGARLTIESADGQGTLVSCLLPTNDDRPPR